MDWFANTVWGPLLAPLIVGMAVAVFQHWLDRR